MNHPPSPIAVAAANLLGPRELAILVGRVGAYHLDEVPPLRPRLRVERRAAMQAADLHGEAEGGGLGLPQREVCRHLLLPSCVHHARARDT